MRDLNHRDTEAQRREKPRKPTHVFNSIFCLSLCLCASVVSPGFSVECRRWPQAGDDAAHGGEVFIRDALAPAVAAFQGIQEDFPHLACHFFGALPVGSTLEPELEAPEP